MQFFSMNTNTAAAARSAAGSDARSASMLVVILDAILLASIFVILPVWSLVLSVLVLVRISLRLLPISPQNTQALSRT